MYKSKEFDYDLWTTQEGGTKHYWARVKATGEVAEISIEVTGEDEPTKYDKRRERWAVICFWALLAYIISTLFLIFVDINVYFCFAFVISTSVCIFSFFKASYIDPEEPTDSMPWYYGAL